MKHRLLFGFIGTILLLLSIYFSKFPYFSPVFGFLIAVIIGLAVWEYYQIAKNKGFEPLSSTGMIASLLYTFTFYLSVLYPELSPLPFLSLFITMAYSFCYYLQRGQSPFANLAITGFGLCYLTIPLSFLLSINYYFAEGSWWLIYLLAIKGFTDTSALFIGQHFGKNKLCPSVSPNKTWEGAIGGLIFGVLASLCLTSLLPDIFHLQIGMSILLGASLSIIAQFGDLAESLLKRDVGVKDSNQLPGMGGALDMVDSLVFTTPFLYTVLRIIG